MKLSDIDFLRLLPSFMRDDEAVIALSHAVNKLIQEQAPALAALSTWDRMDELTEAECDELAWELDIDWYKSGMTLEEKRQTIKDANMIKRKRGTRWAVDQAISNYLQEGFVVEWFETGGAPFTFEIFTTNPDVSDEEYEAFMEAAGIAKNVRSHVLGISYLWQKDRETAVEYGGAASFHRYNFRRCGQTAPKTGKLFADQLTGEKYYIYVRDGHMRIKPTSTAALPTDVFFDDQTTGEKYMLFVYDGNLMMQITDEATEASTIIFDDTKTALQYRLYVSAGELMLQSVAG